MFILVANKVYKYLYHLDFGER